MFSELDLIMSYKFASKDPLMIDVGAHHGSLTLPFAKAGWSVIAFEPENSNYKAFKNNLKNYRKVKVFKEAVSNTSGVKVPFYVSDKHYGIHSLRKFDRTHKCKYWVKAVRLDDKLKKIGVKNVTFLKIDIEGADFLALKSFDFNNYSPEIVMVEFMDSRTVPYFGYKFTDMVKLMLRKGYQCFVSEWSEIKEYGRLGVETESPNWLGCIPYFKLKHKPSWGNLIFVPKSDSEKFETTLKKYLEFLRNGRDMRSNILFNQSSLKEKINILYGNILEITSDLKNKVKDF